MTTSQNYLIKIYNSPFIFLLSLIGATFLLDIVIVIILVIDYIDMLSNGHSGFSIWEFFFWWVLLLQFFVMIIIFVKWINKYYLFENNKLVLSSGIIFKNKQEFTLNMIWCMTSQQTFLWNIFNYWDIHIQIQNKEHVLKWLADPNGFIQFISKFKSQWEDISNKI